jgi:uncharacterized small protein (DUF1192 family)
MDHDQSDVAAQSAIQLGIVPVSPAAARIAALEAEVAHLKAAAAHKAALKAEVAQLMAQKAALSGIKGFDSIGTLLTYLHAEDKPTPSIKGTIPARALGRQHQRIGLISELR